jgi:alkylmercury lyase
VDTDELTAVAHQLAERLCGPHERLRVVLLQLLAQGRPVSLTRLAAAVGTTSALVASTLAAYPDIERDSGGDIVGWGLSLRSTAHQFRLGPTALFTWCAFDTLMYPAILGRTAVVATTCPTTRSAIQLVVHPDAITDLNPPSAVISVVLPDASSCTTIRAAFCAHGHAFATAEAAATWKVTTPRALLLPLLTAHQIARQVAHERLRRAALPGDSTLHRITPSVTQP